MNARRVQAIARKEHYRLIRDFRSLYMAFIIPMLLILLFGYALSLDVDHIPTAAVDHDRTPESRDFLRGLGASVYFAVVAHPPTTAALTDRLDRNQAVLGIVIPHGWSADLKAERQSALQVLIDGSDPNTAGRVALHGFAHGELTMRTRRAHRGAQRRERENGLLGYRFQQLR